MNAWSYPDSISESDAQQMARFLEERARMPDQQRLHAALIIALAPQPGEHALDLGCGTGVITRRLAHAIGSSGTVVGVDVSETMIREARRLGIHPALRFVTGDATNLGYEPASFEVAAAARLLLHVPKPLLVLHEVHRVVQPGGRLGLLEWDWGTLAIDHSQRQITRRILDWRCDNHGGDNWMGRQLPRLCQESGWAVRTIQVLASIHQTEDMGFIATIRRAAAGAQQHDAISETEHMAWIAEIDTRLAQGRFFATMNDYIVVAERM
ncbi:MAG: methyltransferase domain-containing protein [Roseiflexaceae bacterium]|nr:methyltransferase domain-containing protein [Roseiflexaceae bacterium]